MSIIELNTLEINTRPLKPEDLLIQCQQGNGTAQEALYNLYANRMFRVCFRYLESEVEAEDAMIRGFVKVFQNIDKFEYRGKGSLDGWIKRIMVNECLMDLRKRKLLMASIDEQYQLEIQADAINQLQAEDLYGLIRQLPNGYRTVFSMHIIEGYSHKEIGQQLSISENTSKSQLSKAKAMLRRLIIENEN